MHSNCPGGTICSTIKSFSMLGVQLDWPANRTPSITQGIGVGNTEIGV